MFEDDARNTLIKHLGYVLPPTEQPSEGEAQPAQPAQPVEIPQSVEKPTITAEDLFASASPLASESPLVETAAVEEPTEPKESKEATLSVAEQENAEWVSELKQSVIVGDFARAVEVCFKYGRFADALVLSAWGGSELVQQTTVVLRRLSERRTATCASKRRRRSSRWRRSCLAI